MIRKSFVVKTLVVFAGVVGLAQAEVIPLTTPLHSTTAWQSLGAETIWDGATPNTWAANWWAGPGANTNSNNGVLWEINDNGSWVNDVFDLKKGDKVDFKVIMYKEYYGGHDFDALRVWLDDTLQIDAQKAVGINAPSTMVPVALRSTPYEFSYIFNTEGSFDVTARVTCSNDLMNLSNDEYFFGWDTDETVVKPQDWALFDRDVSFIGSPKHGQGETEINRFHVTTRDVPEPTLISLLGCGLLGLLVARRKK